MTRTKLAMYRMQKANEILIEAKDNFAQKHYGLSINRSYYAMFTSARALLALKDLDSSKHSGVIALFNQHIIKVELFPKELSKFLSKAKDIREDVDYADFVKISKEEAQTQIKRAMKFVKEAEKVMQKMINESEEK